jgi:hypothetical protein
VNICIPLGSRVNVCVGIKHKLLTMCGPNLLDFYSKVKVLSLISGLSFTRR